MATESRRFRFTMFETVSDRLDFSSYKFTKADRVLLDKILTRAVERHRHTGQPGATTETTAPPGPVLSVLRSGGTIPASVTGYYRVSVVDAKGQEHLASAPSVAPTTGPIVAPSPPTLQRSTGVLLPGDYLYAVSAYTTDPHQETEVSNPASSGIEAIGGFSVFMPAVPSGADGFNVYRKGPTDAQLHYITTVPRNTTAFVDTGAIAANALRTEPTDNTTNGSSSVSIDLTAGVPADQTVKIYRTFNPTVWDNSLLAWTATLPYTDTGQAPREGSPPSISGAVGGPPKVNLGTEAQGRPPLGLVATTTLATFAVRGPVTPGAASWQWISEFDDARVLALRAALGRGSSPAARPVVVALERRAASTDLWHRFSTDAGDVTATIAVGDQISPHLPMPPDATPGPHLPQGFALRPVVLQNGGGATPTDHDLAVTVTLAVRHGSATTTYTWET